MHWSTHVLCITKLEYHAHTHTHVFYITKLKYCTHAHKHTYTHVCMCTRTHAHTQTHTHNLPACVGTLCYVDRPIMSSTSPIIGRDEWRDSRV